MNRARVTRLLGGLAVAAVLVVAASNAIVIARGSGGVYERASDVPAQAVAIVPGALVYRSGAPSPVLADRLAAALELYRAAKVQRILVTGDNGTNQYDEVTVMLRWLLERGVDPAHVQRDHAGFRTRDSMLRAAKVFRVRHAVVCTQRFHMARSMFLARDAGIEAVGLIADRAVYGGRYRFAAREVIARTVALFDAWVLRRGPRFLGPEIPLEP